MTNQKGKVVSLIFLALSLAGIGYAYYLGQVSQTALLVRIKALEGRVAANNQQIAQANDKMVDGIAYYVCLNRNRDRDQLVLEQSKLILARSRTLIDTIDLVRQQLQMNTQRAFAAKQGNQLPAHLKRYTAFLRQYVPEMPTLTHDSAQHESENWWERLGSPSVPGAATAASFTQLTAQVRRYERQALSQQAQKVGGPCGFTKIVALAVNTADVLAPGSVGEARLFLTEAATSYNPHMSANGKPLTMLPNGAGQVEFNVPTKRKGQSDTVRAHWHGIIPVRTCPFDTVLELDVPYFIVKRHAP